MEAKYNWPVAHREGWPDLSGGEATFYSAVQEFNTKSFNIKVVFINQFGFSRKLCGRRMPQDMDFVDIRRGTDVEFGQSIYEPFGIAPLEPLTYGALCVFSSVSGCASFASGAIAGLLRESLNGTKNMIIADYTAIDGVSLDIPELIRIDRAARNRVEERVSREVADEILALLPKNETETAQTVENGYRIAKNMSWDAVVECYLLPNLEMVLKKKAQTDIRAAG
jgi:hypothetical protein